MTIYCISDEASQLSDSLQSLRTQLAKFAAARDWDQDNRKAEGGTRKYETTD